MRGIQTHIFIWKSVQFPCSILILFKVDHTFRGRPNSGKVFAFSCSTVLVDGHQRFYFGLAE